MASYPEAGRLQDLATQVKQVLGGVKPTKVIVDTSLYTGSPVGPGWSDENINSTYLTSVYALSTDAGKIDPANIGYAPRYTDSATGAADIFAHYLGLPPSAVVSGTAPSKPDSPSSPTAPGAVLASVQSAPLIRIIETMLANSDNMLAEAMARQVALATGHPASFAGAAAAVTERAGQAGPADAGRAHRGRQRHLACEQGDAGVDDGDPRVRGAAGPSADARDVHRPAGRGLQRYAARPVPPRRAWRTRSA